MSMTRRLLLLILALAGVQVTVGAQAAQAGDKLVFIVRHAEKASATDPDPSLSDAGKDRAIALAAALRDARVSDILVTPRKRTAETAAPLAAALELTMHVVPFGASTPEHAASVAAAVRAARGAVVLVVGHSNSVNAIIAALGGPKMPDLCDAAYANFFVVRLPASGVPSLTRAQYGAADPAGANGCAAAAMR